MAKAPAVLIVVRHGARLDAADKQWHLSSPTPYDPPLTYGGWTQSRALGARIASILRSRETDDISPISPTDQVDEQGVPASGSSEKRRRRHRVVIHTSPFLRCVQTSIAISSGLAQNPGHVRGHSVGTGSNSSIPIKSDSPQSRPTVTTGSPRLSPIPEPSASTGRESDHASSVRRAVVRVDAFLGEWMSPDYFELITPPPSSLMMVAGAKADLLRREDYKSLIHARDISQSPASVQGFPGGWGSPAATATTDKDHDVEEDPLSSMVSLAQSLPRRPRTSSLSSVGNTSSRHSGRGAARVLTTTTAEHGIYNPPIPGYAISNSDPIPPGYVSHARDACVETDYQWDSMRNPHDWGNGGEYGEEWSSMHKRFRKGAQCLVDWYRNNEDAAAMKTKWLLNHAMSKTSKADTDEDTDLVVILVSHGAGCNALIGALTNQPVLIDVSMASLTMAVRKEDDSPSMSHSPSGWVKTVAEEYDMKLVANTEHLRPPTSASTRSARVSSLPPVSTYRQRYGPGGIIHDGVTGGDSTRVTSNTTFGSIRRTASASTSTRSPVQNQARSNSVGLWSAPSMIGEEDVEEGDDIVLNFGHDSSPLSKLPQVENMSMSKAEDTQPKEAVGEDDLAPLGLWGSPRPPGEAEKNREYGPKRRWTINERAVV